MKVCVASVKIIGMIEGGDLSLEKKLDAIRWHASSMIEQKQTEKLINLGHNFYCEISTEFEEVVENEISGYIFVVKVNHRDKSALIQMIIRPLKQKIPEKPEHVDWRHRSPERIELKEMLQHYDTV